MRKRFWLSLALVLAAFAQPCRAEGLSTEQRTAAVQETIGHEQKCSSIGDFYWEIGDAKGALAGGAVGTKYNPDTVIGIDSASKLVFGSYVLEKLGKGVEPSADQIRQLTMTAGYPKKQRNMVACSSLFGKNVAHCAKKDGSDNPDPASIGKFAYGNAGDEKLAVDLGLGDNDAAAMAAEYKKYLGDDLDFTFRTLQMAGGLKSTPRNYARFLRKILSGQLRMRNYLGAHAVCAYDGLCPGNVLYTPAPLAWHYSLNHWVEDDPDGDGAFSSTGMEGFYPWISADKKTYGILARQSFSLSAAKQSAYCGIAIRKSWMTGKEQ